MTLDRRREVLVADDSTVTRALLKDLLTEWGYEPRFASDGDEAWACLRESEAPRLVLLDWMMPGLDGVALCRLLRQLPDRPYVYVILITSRSGDEEVVEALDAGADDFLKKPLQPDELRSRLAVGMRLLHYHDRLADQNELLNALLAAIPSAFCFKDRDGRWRQANDTQRRLFGLAEHPWEGLREWELADLPGARAGALRAWSASDERCYAGAGLFREELTIASGPGSEQVFEFIKAPLFHGDGSRKGLLTIGHDITDRKRLEERLRQEAQYDLLTGLLTRRHLERELRAAFAGARRHGEPFCLCLCDVDHFKSINDRQGHARGDQVLAAFGRIVQAELREGDIAGRYGGDEFCLAFPHTRAADAVACLERIRAEVARLRLTGADGRPFSFTSSFGLAEPKDEVTDLEKLLERADRSLYAAKAGGRNRLVAG